MEIANPEEGLSEPELLKGEADVPLPRFLEIRMKFST